MSNKFSQKGPAYVMPPWCLAPPLTPLPPILPPMNFLQAEGRLTWNKPDHTWVNLVASARNINLVAPFNYAKDVAIQGYVMNFSITVNWTTRKISAGIFAYKSGVFQASASWNTEALGVLQWWKHEFEQPDFKIPNYIGGTCDSWLSIWP